VIQRLVRVVGRVQGVGFRVAVARKVGERADVRGYVRNLADGSVEALFAGPEDEVLALVAWCRVGPAGARVERIEVAEQALTFENGSFQVRP